VSAARVGWIEASEASGASGLGESRETNRDTRSPKAV